MPAECTAAAARVHFSGHWHRDAVAVRVPVPLHVLPVTIIVMVTGNLKELPDRVHSA
jgi:hypothetical protein